VIGFADLTVRYGGTTALHGIAGRACDGEWLGLIGPNGAGKTTLLNAIARLLPYSGSVTVCDRPADRLSRRELARLIAYVPQRPLLPPDMTVSDYVLLGRTAHIGYLRTETATDRRVCAAAIDRLDLGVMTGRILRTMSGGELQRVVLARALAQEAPVLLLDEPTSALDLGRRMDALELIDDVRRERSLTVLSAIHDLTLAGQFADRLVLLADGQIAASGTAREVLSDAVLAEHFGTGVQVLTTDTGDIAVISRRLPRGDRVTQASAAGHARD
jgi:iron complex transport system ATP-binding protein